MSKTLADNLKFLLKRDDISSSKLSEASGVDKPRISRMLSGKTANPQVESIAPIAEFFNITIDQLVGRSPLPYDNSYGVIIPISRLLIPFIEWASVPFWLKIKDNYLAKKSIDAKSNISASSFALTISTAKYEPAITMGCTLLVDPLAKPNNRDYVVVNSTHREHIFLAQYIKQNNSILYPLLNVG